MSIVVRIPTPLRRLTNGQDKVDVEADSLGGVIDAMNEQYPGLPRPDLRRPGTAAELRERLRQR